jgi:hypothetical protein
MIGPGTAVERTVVEQHRQDREPSHPVQCRNVLPAAREIEVSGHGNSGSVALAEFASAYRDHLRETPVQQASSRWPIQDLADDGRGRGVAAMAAPILLLTRS